MLAEQRYTYVRG